MFKRAVVPICGLLCAAALAGCSHSHRTTRSELRERRGDLVEIAEALAALQPSIARELASARAVWPLIDRGLVRRGQTGHASLIRSRRLAGELEAAQRAAAALPVEPVPNAEQLTGPAAGIAGIYQQAQLLLDRSWAVLVRSQQPVGTAAYRYLLENVNLYVAAVYDAYFNLSYIGRAVGGAYRRLGGETRFGRRLTPRSVGRLAAFYSKGLRLSPHPWEDLLNG